jgi:hypothetical protein
MLLALSLFGKLSLVTLLNSFNFGFRIWHNFLWPCSFNGSSHCCPRSSRDGRWRVSLSSIGYRELTTQYFLFYSLASVMTGDTSVVSVQSATYAAPRSRQHHCVRPDTTVSGDVHTPHSLSLIQFPSPSESSAGSIKEWLICKLPD